MADLSPEESYGTTTDNDVVLCKMKYSSKGELTVDPDFTKGGSKSNRIVGVGKGNSIYEFKIQFVTGKVPQKMQEDVIGLKTEQVEQSHDFDLVSNFDVRMEFNGEITRAVNFTESFSPIYIYYELHLPEGWKAEDNCCVCGVSESCVPFYNKDRVPICHFSFPLQFSLRKSTKAKEWPYILYLAFTNEWLTHDKDAGFGVMSLPYPGGPTNGSEIEVQTWRPYSETIYDWLRRYFLGGTHLLKDSSYLIPYANKTPYANRLGFRTESSGSIYVRLHSMMQVNKDIAADELAEDEVENSYFHPMTFSVICAFQKSFVRLKSIKRNLNLSKGINTQKE